MLELMHEKYYRKKIFEVKKGTYEIECDKREDAGGAALLPEW